MACDVTGIGTTRAIATARHLPTVVARTYMSLHTMLEVVTGHDREIVAMALLPRSIPTIDGISTARVEAGVRIDHDLIIGMSTAGRLDVDGASSSRLRKK